MIISIDYDDTFTRAPDMFREWIASAERHGHQVVCVTSRKECESPPCQPSEPFLPESIVVICADDQFKEKAARNAGYKVDIWVDDSPGMIAPQLKLDW